MVTWIAGDEYLTLPHPYFISFSQSMKLPGRNDLPPFAKSTILLVHFPKSSAYFPFAWEIHAKKGKSPDCQKSS